jgi:hypothetical protein
MALKDLVGMGTDVKRRKKRARNALRRAVRGLGNALAES